MITVEDIAPIIMAAVERMVKIMIGEVEENENKGSDMRGEKK